MVERIVEWCARNRFLVFTGTVILTVWGSGYKAADV